MFSCRLVYSTKMIGVFARKIANIDKHKWRIIASGGSRILDSELNVTNVLLSIHLYYTPDDIKDFASQILKNRYAVRTCCMPSETYDALYITFGTTGVKLKILIQQVYCRSN